MYADMRDGQGEKVFPHEVARLWSARGKLKLLAPWLSARIYLRSATRIGARVRLRGRPWIVNRGTMTIGDRVQLVSTVAKLELVTLPGGHLDIGNRVYINYGTSIVASNHVKISDGCLIGAHVTVMDTDFHRVEDKMPDRTGIPIVLEERVWLANRSIVLKGITIGHDSVVAAGSVVVEDVPPRVVVAGVPARVIRRF